MSHEDDLATGAASPHDIARYESLGLIANPFAAASGEGDAGVACEIAAAGNSLLVAILNRSKEEAPKPLWVEKADIPSFYPLTAGSHAEASLAVDDSLNVMYSYVHLFMWRVGLVRATLGVLAERVAFRTFERTLELYIAKVLESPDVELASFAVLGSDRLDAFGSSFAKDPQAAITAVFGEPEIERRPELAEAFDLRRQGLEEDGEESEASPEIDATIGDAPGTQQLMEEAAANRDEDAHALLDYFVEHTRVHLSAVIGRGLRVYHDRGMTALSEELKITKAPRKTLAALIQFADLRYRKVALIYDAFESWVEIDPSLRSKLVGSMSDIRWNNDKNAFIVIMAIPGEAPELEEVFGQGDRLSWDFSGLVPLQEHPDEILEDVVNGWLKSAALEDSRVFTLDDPVLAELISAAEGSLRSFVGMASAAFESAADRGVAELDAASLEAGKAKGAE